MKSKLIHRQYSDKPDRPDLRALAKCNNINGEICGPERLTADNAKVTCKSCLRLIAQSAKYERSSAALSRAISGEKS